MYPHQIYFIRWILNSWRQPHVMICALWCWLYVLYFFQEERYDIGHASVIKQNFWAVLKPCKPPKNTKFPKACWFVFHQDCPSLQFPGQILRVFALSHHNVHSLPYSFALLSYILAAILFFPPSLSHSLFLSWLAVWWDGALWCFFIHFYYHILFVSLISTVMNYLRLWEYLWKKIMFPIIYGR